MAANANEMPEPRSPGRLPMVGLQLLSKDTDHIPRNLVDTSIAKEARVWRSITIRRKPMLYSGERLILSNRSTRSGYPFPKWGITMVSWSATIMRQSPHC